MWKSILSCVLFLNISQIGNSLNNYEFCRPLDSKKALLKCASINLKYGRVSLDLYPRVVPGSNQTTEEPGIKNKFGVTYFLTDLSKDALEFGPEMKFFLNFGRLLTYLMKGSEAIEKIEKKDRFFIGGLFIAEPYGHDIIDTGYWVDVFKALPQGFNVYVGLIEDELSTRIGYSEFVLNDLDLFVGKMENGNRELAIALDVLVTSRTEYLFVHLMNFKTILISSPHRSNLIAKINYTNLLNQFEKLEEHDVILSVPNDVYEVITEVENRRNSSHNKRRLNNSSQISTTYILYLFVVWEVLETWI